MSQEHSLTCGLCRGRGARWLIWPPGSVPRLVMCTDCQARGYEKEKSAGSSMVCKLARVTFIRYQNQIVQEVLNCAKPKAYKRLRMGFAYSMPLVSAHSMLGNDGLNQEAFFILNGATLEVARNVREGAD